MDGVEMLCPSTTYRYRGMFFVCVFSNSFLSFHLFLIVNSVCPLICSETVDFNSSTTESMVLLEVVASQGQKPWYEPIDLFRNDVLRHLRARPKIQNKDMVVPKFLSALFRPAFPRNTKYILFWYILSENGRRKGRRYITSNNQEEKAISWQTVCIIWMLQHFL